MVRPYVASSASMAAALSTLSMLRELRELAAANVNTADVGTPVPVRDLVCG